MSDETTNAGDNNEPVTKGEFRIFKGEFRTFRDEMVQFRAETTAKFAAIDSRFKLVDDKLDSLDKRVGRIETRIETLRTEIVADIEGKVTALLDPFRADLKRALRVRAAPRPPNGRRKARRA